MDTSITSKFFEDVLTDVKFFDSGFPRTYEGFIGFLAQNFIFIVPWKDENMWTWAGFEITVKNEKIGYSEDFTKYLTYMDMWNAAIVESFCYLLNKIEHESN